MYGNATKWGYEEACAGYLDFEKNTCEVAFVSFDSAHLQMSFVLGVKSMFITMIIIWCLEC